MYDVIDEDTAHCSYRMLAQTQEPENAPLVDHVRIMAGFQGMQTGPAPLDDHCLARTKKGPGLSACIDSLQGTNLGGRLGGQGQNKGTCLRFAGATLRFGRRRPEWGLGWSRGGFHSTCLGVSVASVVW